MLYERVHAIARTEFADRLDVWRSLEAKAQGTIALAGTFLAAAFAFAREVKVGTDLSERTLLALALALLAAAVLFAVRSLRVRSVSDPPTAATVLEQVKLLTRLGDPTPGSIDNFERDVADMWLKPNDDLAKANADKARLVRRSQWCLTLGALVVTALTFVVILTP